MQKKSLYFFNFASLMCTLYEKCTQKDIHKFIIKRDGWMNKTMEMVEEEGIKS